MILRSIKGTGITLLVGVGIWFGASVAAAESWKNTPYPILNACTRFELNIFQDVDFSAIPPLSPAMDTANALDDWKSFYHNRVSRVVEEDIGVQTGVSHSPLRRFRDPPDCMEEDYGLFMKPQSELSSLAGILPTWQHPANAARLTQLDISEVLLEYLRMYECALLERLLVLPEYVARQETERQRWKFGLPALSVIFFDTVDISGIKTGDERVRILRELAISRRALHKTITLISGMDRMRPLYEEINCFQQTSLDIRNAMSLAADAASCLPRIWNHKDSLRDFE